MRHRRRKLRGRELKKQRKMIIISVFALFLTLSIGYAAFQTVIRINVKANIVRDGECVVGKVWEFEQKDEIQEFKVPCSGTYKLETWGAQGGNALTIEGGYGGYSVGTSNLKRSQQLYIVVGGRGLGGSKSNLNTNLTNSVYHIGGGYNGGGAGNISKCSSTYRFGSSGGGATHIGFLEELLAQYENSQDKLLIVAGGGGGAFTFENHSYGAYGNGASSGGQIGNVAYFTLVTHTKTHYATGGTQNFGGLRGSSYDDNISITGSFGHGGNGNGTSCNDRSGGGSGFYGGGYGHFAPGAGGSSYIGNPSLTDKSMYCYDCEESLDLTKPNIFTVSTTGESNYKDNINCPNGYSETPISKCAKKGDGYAKITLITKSY